MIVTATLQLWHTATSGTWQLNAWQPLSETPSLLQAVVALTILDFTGYWLHRLFHTQLLWPLHRLHHLPTQLDWFIALRFHPLDSFISLAVFTILFDTFAIPTNVIAPYFVFNMLYNLFVHSNVNFAWGKRQHLFNDPHFHALHHTPEGMRKNFSGCIFKIWDFIFGTALKTPVVHQPSEKESWSELWQALLFPYAIKKGASLFIALIICAQFSQVFLKDDVFPFTHAIYYTDAAARPKISITVTTAKEVFDLYPWLPAERLIWHYERLQYNFRTRGESVVIEDIDRHTSAIRDIVLDVPQSLRLPGNKITFCAKATWDAPADCFYEQIF